MKAMKSKVAIILFVFFMLTMVPMQAKADENIYGVLITNNSEYMIITETKEYKLTYTGNQDLSELVGSVISLTPTAETEDNLQADTLNKVESAKTVKADQLRYVKVIARDGIFYYEAAGKDFELKSDKDLTNYVDKNCDITVQTTTYSFDSGNRTITFPWKQVTDIAEGNPYLETYKTVVLKGRAKIKTNSYIEVGDKLYTVYFDSDVNASKYRNYNNRYVTVKGEQKYITDLRDNSTKVYDEIHSSSYTLTYKVHYKSVKAKGFVSNNLKIGKYTLDKSGDKYKSFIINLKGKVAITDNGVKTTTSTVVNPTSVTKISTTNLKVYNHLSSLKARNKTFKRAKALHNGSPHNSCVYFSSQALREVGVSIPRSMCVTNKYSYKLRTIGWKKITSYKKLTPGSVCFTKDAWGGNGKPTHTYVFMGWVKKGDYSEAYICDNQAGEYGGKVLHKRNVAQKAKHGGQYKDAFGFAMVSPATYNYIK